MIQFDIVTIKQIPDDYATLTGLHKYGRSKMPQTYEYLQPGIGPDGRFITGFDEKSMAIRQIKDTAKREEKQKEILEFRESLQRLSGIEDLSGTSPFWNTYGVKLVADSDMVLNGQNPMDVLKYCILLSNRFAAPDEDTAAHPEYQQSKYYCYTNAKVEAETVSAQKAKDRARSKLLDVSDDKDQLVLLGQYLEGDKYKSTMSLNTLYKMLSDFIEDSKESENRRRFLKAAETSVDELQFKITVERAIKKKIIRFRDGYYQKGQVTLGKNPAEVLSNLKKPEFANEFIQIRDEVLV